MNEIMLTCTKDQHESFSSPFSPEKSHIWALVGHYSMKPLQKSLGWLSVIFSQSSINLSPIFFKWIFVMENYIGTLIFAEKFMGFSGSSWSLMLNLAFLETSWLFFTNMPLDITNNNIETDLKSVICWLFTDKNLLLTSKNWVNMHNFKSTLTSFWKKLREGLVIAVLWKIYFSVVALACFSSLAFGGP